MTIVTIDIDLAKNVFFVNANLVPALKNAAGSSRCLLRLSRMANRDSRSPIGKDQPRALY